MDFNEYQEIAITTAIYPDEAWVLYPAIGVANEAGEVVGKVKKWIRDDTDDWKNGAISEDRRQNIADEMGDVLWYLAALANDLGISLDKIAENNIDKLLSRKERGTLSGDGDKR